MSGRWLVGIAWLALAGCADPGALQAPRSLLDAAPLAAGGGHAAPDWPTERWWQRYDDPALAALVERSLAGQPSLQQVLARVRAAAARADAVAAGAQPQGQLAVDVMPQRFSARGLVPPALAGTTHTIASAQLGAGWDLDLFGRQRAALDAAIGQQRAAEADAQAARSLLAAEVATHWFALGRALALQELAAQAVVLREQALALTRLRVDAGLDGGGERLAAEAALAQARQEQAALADAVARERHALAELSGQAPAALATASPALPAAAAPVLPSVLGADLIGRRADLVAQRWRVEAALSDVTAARAAFYPDVNLVAFAGLSSLGLDTLLSAAARTAGVGPALRLPLFDGGRLRAQLAGRGADADAAIEAWNATLLRALREVADELGSLQALQAQRSAQAEAAAAVAGARALAEQRRRAGLATQRVVLDAEAAVLAQRRTALELQARHLTAEVALTRALGGGFQDPPR